MDYVQVNIIRYVEVYEKLSSFQNDELENYH